MTPDDITLTNPAANATRDHDPSADALDEGLAAAFGGETTHTRPASADPESGTVVAGKYKLTEKVGEGGMGSVWAATQSEPVKRKVAVKLIKAGMDSKAVLARFDAERQALAVMDHPNIAKVLDGGLHDGRPYFVMELVKGVPITQFCDERKLTPHQRLELFLQACQAIQHAHQKGVIHRDIKPSNVLVALYDDRAVVKVIDFGIAKATGGALTDYTLETGFGAVVGTPAYMSPEQASLNNLDIDTRSDVYALGVLLYELLAGSPPFSGKELQQKGMLEMLRVVREEEPPRPSHKLSTADALPSLSANRGTEPKKLTGLLRNELDWIVMKALEKDRTRRYETANGFAADVQRYLSGEAVDAHPPSLGYRLRKFVRRNRVQVTAAAAVLVALLGGGVGTSVGLVRAEAAREREAEERGKAERLAEANAQLAEQETRAKSDAETKRKEAETNLAYAREGQKVIHGVFGRMSEGQATKANLQQAAKELATDTVGDPISLARLRIALADALIRASDPDTAHGLYQSARSFYIEQFGPDHPATLDCGLNLAWAESSRLKHDQAITLYRDVYTRTRTAFGPGHQRTVVARYRLAIGYARANRNDVALDLLEDAVPGLEKSFGRTHDLTLEAMHSLARKYFDLKMAADAHRFIPVVYQRYREREREPGESPAQGERGIDVDLMMLVVRPPIGTPGLLPETPEPVARASRIYDDCVKRLGQLHLESLLARRQLAEALRTHHSANPPGRALDKSEAILCELAAAMRDRDGFETFRLETARLLDDLCTAREKRDPESWRTFRARSRYGEVLVGLGKTGEGEQHLLKGYEGLNGCEIFLPESAREATPEALDRLVALYSATNQPDQVKKYKEQRAKFPPKKDNPPPEKK